MTKYLGLLSGLIASLILSACSPSVQEYSDALSGTWESPLEDSEEGYIERGTIQLDFSPIPEGKNTGKVTASYSCHIDGELAQTISADATVTLSGTYIIDEDEYDYPLDFRWDVNSLNVTIDKLTIEDIVGDFQASMEELVGSAYGLGGGSRQAIRNALLKQLESSCRSEVIERNSDPGGYGVEVDGNTLRLILADDAYLFTRQ